MLTTTIFAVKQSLSQAVLRKGHTHELSERGFRVGVVVGIVPRCQIPSLHHLPIAAARKQAIRAGERVRCQGFNTASELDSVQPPSRGNFRVQANARVH